MVLRTIIMLILAVACLATQPLVAQEQFDHKIDFSKSRLDSTTRALCNEHISGPLRYSIVSADMDPRLVPAFVDAEDYPPGDTVPYLKFILASDGTMFAELITLRHLEDGEYELIDRITDVPPGHRVKMKFRDLTGDEKPDIVVTSRGGQPLLETMMVFELDETDRVQPMSRRSEWKYDINGLQGVAVAVIDSLGRNDRPAIEVWQDDSLRFAASYTRVRHQFNEEERRFIPTSVDTLPELPYWCDGRRAMYIPQDSLDR
ncbi:MAG: hypothetical protein GF341_10980 [candidate division Zixibacteria bacterium]|nr:hypothetical protein [candidate division Zixibacteria bacterium]